MHWIIPSSLAEVQALHPREMILPGDAEPAWLRREAEYARELPRLRLEQRARPEAESHWPGILEWLRMALSRG